jgi:hypothetical protein
MKSPWTPERDKRLIDYQLQGLTARQIAVKLGTTRNAVIGRSIRLRGIVYQSQLDSWARANAKRKKGPRKPEEMRRKAIAQMRRDLAGGMSRPEAMLRAFKGALWRDIGDYFGMSRQAAEQMVRSWKQRMALPPQLRRGPGRPRKKK